MRYSIVIAACLALLVGKAADSQVRSISTAFFEHGPSEAGEGAIGFGAEEAIIVAAGDDLSLIGRCRYASPDSSYPYSGAGAGASVVFSPGLYADLVASCQWNAEAEVLMGEVESSFNIETSDLYTGLRERLRFGGSPFASLTTLFARYGFNEVISAWVSYTLSFESDTGLDHSIWGYIELAPAPAWAASLGGTAASFHIGGSDAVGAAYSALAALAYRPTPRASIKYQYELFLGDRRSGAMSHTLILDLRFP